MLRRTLLAFVALLFLVLAITLGYAALGLSGPDTAISDARRALAAGRYAHCVRTLDLAEQGIELDGDPELRAGIYDLRHRAYYGLGNLQSALRDLARLRELLPDDMELAQREIRWLIEAGHAERAIDRSEERLATHPDEPRTLELAGEACQARYQELVRSFLGEYATLLDQEAADRAFAALRTWLYRDPDDPAAAEGYEAFENVLRERRPAAYAAGDYAVELQEIRGLVSKAQRYFRDALESDAEPVAAYLGLGYALRQGSRQDDLQWLGEIYLHRFDHVYTTLAAVDLAGMHFAAGRYRAVREVAQRFLPTGTWQERLADGRLDAAVADLRLAEARALYELDDKAALAELCAEVERMQAHDAIDLEPSLHWILALGALARGDVRTGMQELQTYDEALRELPSTEDVTARRIAVFEQRIAVARAQNWGTRFFEYVYQALSRLDQTNPRYFVERARTRFESEDVEGALFDLRTARTLAQHDDDVLRLQARALDAQQARSGRDSASQLRRCLELGVEIPYDVDDLLLLPLAELALERGHPTIALACAQRAAATFNWARWPRELIARAALALDRPDLAEQSAEALLAHHPGDLQGLRRLREARQLQDEPIDDLVYDLLVAGEPDPAIAASLLRQALDRGELDTATHLARTIERRWADRPAALLPVAEAHRASGRIEQARETLQRAADVAAESDPATFAEATERYFLLTAATSDDRELVERLFERALASSRDDTARLVELADELQRTGLDELAFRVMSILLTDDRHRAARTGENYLVAGRLALRLDRLDRANAFLFAALTFPETESASRPLALLLIAQGREAEARETYWQKTVDDLVSACLSARAGRTAPALAWARGRVAESSMDLPALALVALFDEEATVLPGVRELATTAPDQLLDALTFVQAEDFATVALRYAQELVRAAPDNLVARTFLARAHAGSGDREKGLQILSEVVAEAPLLVPAYDAAVDILDRQSLAMPDLDRLVDRFLDPELIGQGLATTGMLELATRREAVRLLSIIGQNPDALEGLATLWQHSPGASTNGLQYVELLAQHGRVDLALSLCEAIEPRIAPHLREPLLTLYFHLLEQRIEKGDDPALRAEAVAAAKRFLEQDGPLGVLVHFLLDQDEAIRGPLDQRAEVTRLARAKELVEAHLERIRAGNERLDWFVVETLRRIHDVDGRARALRIAEQLLRDNPSQIELWLQRSDWLAEEGHVDEAVDSLRWLGEYLSTSPAMLGSVEIAARAGRSSPDEETRLRANLDPALLDTPIGRHVIGLLAFRQAEYARALGLLRQGGKRPDGAHLYFAGLAALILGDDETAHEDLAALARDYPRSSLSFNAGHFARQLSH